MIGRRHDARTLILPGTMTTTQEARIAPGMAASVMVDLAVGAPSLCGLATGKDDAAPPP